MGVVVNPQHPLSSKTEIRLHELQDYLVAIPSPEISLRELIDTAQEIAAVTLPQTLVTNSIEMMKAFARLSGGAALLTDIDALREIAAGELVHVPLGGRVTMPQLLVALTRTGRHPSAAAAAFVEQLQGAFDVAHR
jgi:DNA-binding transcriptional LysR family regulator